jgi:hypothetical protein
MKKEYEYSYKVTSIKEFIQYRESNNFIKISETTQTRTLYKNDTYIMARITIEEDNLKHTRTEYLDFKENNETNQELKIRKETDILNLNNENKAFAKTLIEFLNLKVDKELIRTRYTYQKGNVKFEIDDYTNPKMKVLAIEGNSEEVNKINQELMPIITKLKIKE